MAKLILVRHGASIWNEQGLWTGLTDISLSEKGKKEAEEAGLLLRTTHIDMVFISSLIRAKETADIIISLIDKKDIPLTADKALNERDYGELTGKNKWKIKEEFGETQFLKWRRSWDFPLPKGETLKDVYNRTVPYYVKNIEPLVKKGKNVLIVAHGNSLRALIKKLENISDENIPSVEITTGEIYIYDIDSNGNVMGKEVKNTNTWRA